MRILCLNQAFHPDVVASAQYLSDVALALSAAGHEITVLTSATGYDDRGRRFARHERWNGIRILRVRSPRLGKIRRWMRAIDFGSYMIACAAKLAGLPAFDVVVAMTSPPLVSTLAAWFVRIKGGRLVFWVLDLNPDEAIAAGWLTPGSVTARVLESALRQSLLRSDVVVVLDRFMRDRILAKGIPPERVRIVPPWSQDDDVKFDAAGRSRFRREHGLDGKFVVMYSGNHSPCNPLDTWFSAIARLSGDPAIHFCSVGGGSDFARLRAMAEASGLSNVTFIPYRPRTELAATLSAADMHVVSLGTPFVGILHPSKIYNVLRIGLPLLYFGPAESHIGELAANGCGGAITRVDHGDVSTAVAVIQAAVLGSLRSEVRPETARFAKDRLMTDLLDAIVSTARG